MSGGPGAPASGLFVINSEKALMAAIGAVFGAYPLVQHRRNNWEFPGHRPPPIHFQHRGRLAEGVVMRGVCGRYSSRFVGLSRQHGLPVRLHVHHGPSSGGCLVQYAVQAANRRLPIIGVLSLRLMVLPMTCSGGMPYTGSAQTRMNSTPPPETIKVLNDLDLM